MIRCCVFAAFALLFSGCSVVSNYILDGRIQTAGGAEERHIYGSASALNGQFSELRFSTGIPNSECEGYFVPDYYRQIATTNDEKKNQPPHATATSNVRVSCSNFETGNIRIIETKAGYVGQGEIGGNTVSFRLMNDLKGHSL